MKSNHQTIQCWRARWSRSFSIFVKKKSNRKQIKKPTEPNLKSNKCWRIKPKTNELKKKKQANLSESFKPKLIKKPNLKSNKCSMMKLKKHELQNKKKKNQTWVNLLKKKKEMATSCWPHEKIKTSLWKSGYWQWTTSHALPKRHWGHPRAHTCNNFFHYLKYLINYEATPNWNSKIHKNHNEKMKIHFHTILVFFLL